MVLKNPGAVRNHPLEPATVPDPTPGAGEILIRVRACGVCHTDLHIVEGELPPVKTPLIPGHQVVGAVQACGPRSGKFKVGDPVGVPWLNRTCGACEACRRGDENLCEEARFTGYHVDGGYAPYMTAPEAFAYKIPDQYPHVQAAPLLCAGVIGYRALRICGLLPGERLGLFGFGASAHIVIQIARHRGCPVYVFSRSASHRALARRLGAVWTGTSQQSAPEPLDRAVLFAPAGRLIPDALRNLRKGGSLAIAAIYLDKIPEMDYGAYLYGERSIRSVTASTRRDAEELLALAAQIPIKTDVKTFALGQANEALNLLKAGRITGAAVLDLGQTNKYF